MQEIKINLFNNWRNHFIYITLPLLENKAERKPSKYLINLGLYHPSLTPDDSGIQVYQRWINDKLTGGWANFPNIILHKDFQKYGIYSAIIKLLSKFVPENALQLETKFGFSIEIYSIPFGVLVHDYLENKFTFFERCQILKTVDYRSYPDPPIYEFAVNFADYTNYLNINEVEFKDEITRLPA